ncbi:hypothetical protein [Plantactinospora endophytica]|uniref:Sporulation delaying protein family toxin n=1 Tax=Plantactinospora endophytica TaxID=673535 RepID=A0ABQ4EBV6_9ACTN|nr:hypothetical protein [Plantactinospora endophytica]GIG92217.1 hypothetical protein Pen02_71530 [Plantactinospora endophytica]
MEKIRGQFHRRRVAAGLVLSVTAAGSMVVVGPSPAAAQRPAASAVTVTEKPAKEVPVDPAALLKGLVFGVGPAAERYPDLALTSVPATPENIAAIDRLLADGEKVEPGFVDRFAAAMRSGDHVEIQLGLEDAGDVIARVVEVEARAQMQDGTGTGQCAAITLAVNIQTAVNITTAIAVLIINWIAVINIQYMMMSPPVDSSEVRTLPVEKWVDAVARTL